VSFRQAQRGFTYLIALFAVAVLGAGLASVGTVWHTASVREKEAELLYAGNAYRNAIASYVARGPSIYPTSLEQLLKDPRFPNTVRHLRTLYRDPITNSSDWGLVVAPGGGILGVYSKSEARPRKLTNFDAPNHAFEERAMQLNEKMTYREWQFVHVPKVPAAGARRGGTLRQGR